MSQKQNIAKLWQILLSNSYFCKLNCNNIKRKSRTFQQIIRLNLYCNFSFLILKSCPINYSSPTVAIVPYNIPKITVKIKLIRKTLITPVTNKFSRFDGIPPIVFKIKRVWTCLTFHSSLSKFNLSKAFKRMWYADIHKPPPEGIPSKLYT